MRTKAEGRKAMQNVAVSPLHLCRLLPPLTPLQKKTDHAHLWGFGCWLRQNLLIKLDRLCDFALQVAGGLRTILLLLLFVLEAAAAAAAAATPCSCLVAVGASHSLLDHFEIL